MKLITYLFMKPLLPNTVLLFLYLAFSLSSAAQPVSGPKDKSRVLAAGIEQIQILEQQQLQPLNYNNQVLLQQSGSRNQAFIDQINPYSNPNLAIAHQRGAMNEAELLQEGSGNESSLTQEGMNNRYRLRINGMDNKTAAIQRGRSNHIDQDLSGSAMDYVLIQEGSFNEIVQQENSSQTTAPAYTIHQRGSGMKIEIRQGNIYH